VSWAKLDDQFHAHRKAKRAWKGHPRALGLHLLAISYCAGHLTDGFVDDEFVEEKIPAQRERSAVTDALVDAGLWAREGEGWQINDWLDFNPSRDEVLDRRRRDSERKKRKESERTPRGIRSDSETTPNDPSRAPAFPDPTRPDHYPPSPPRAGGTGRKRDREKSEQAERALAGQRQAFAREHFPDLHPDAVHNTAALLRQRGKEPSVENLRSALDGVVSLPDGRSAA
jgi:hypothetical protein